MIYVPIRYLNGLAVLDLSAYFSYNGSYQSNTFVSLPLVTTSGVNITVSATTGTTPGIFYLRGFVSENGQVGIPTGSTPVYARTYF